MLRQQAVAGARDTRTRLHRHVHPLYPLLPPAPPPRARRAAPQLLDSLLSHIADQIAVYVRYQIDSGADCVMMFDSWGGQLPPMLWDKWSRPYIERIVQQVGGGARWGWWCEWGWCD